MKHQEPLEIRWWKLQLQFLFIALFSQMVEGNFTSRFCWVEFLFERLRATHEPKEVWRAVQKKHRIILIRMSVFIFKLWFFYFVLEISFLKNIRNLVDCSLISISNASMKYFSSRNQQKLYCKARFDEVYEMQRCQRSQFNSNDHRASMRYLCSDKSCKTERNSCAPNPQVRLMKNWRKAELSNFSWFQIVRFAEFFSELSLLFAMIPSNLKAYWYLRSLFARTFC